jgi:hypothetical protein
MKKKTEKQLSREVNMAVNRKEKVSTKNFIKLKRLSERRAGENPI